MESLGDTIASAIVARLNSLPIENTASFSEENGWDYLTDVIPVTNRLELAKVIEKKITTTTVYALTEQGSDTLTNGSDEAQFYASLTDEGVPIRDAPKAAMGAAKASGWVKLEKGRVLRVDGAEIIDIAKNTLQTFADGGIDALSKKDQTVYVKKRKLIQASKVKIIELVKGADFGDGSFKSAKDEDFTVEAIKSGAWKDMKYKPYNFDCLGIAPSGGHLHPLLKVRAAFREILLEMGFEEMPANRFVENSFWNFDALFQPQQHPARDAHDTFFLTNPEKSKFIPAEYLERVRETHERGFKASTDDPHASIGWRYPWNEDTARTNLLRTHTTAVSARMLYQVGQQQPFIPKRYFSIDRVYRNETVDATHLAEFHQVEGVVADYDLTLGDLIGTISQFFHKWGLTDLRFKPAYNPYTEPSMEIFAYHPLLEKWIEIGNSGMFRPEMLKPMGLPPNVRVIAWGLSLERPTMIKYNVEKIKYLMGHSVDFSFVRDSPICDIQLHDKFDARALGKAAD